MFLWHQPLSWVVCKILSLKHTWVASLTFRFTWCLVSRDHSNRHQPFPMGVPLVLALYLQRNSRYWGSNVSRSRFLTFLGHVTSLVTSPFDWAWTLSYRCSIGTDTLSPKDFEILRLKCIWVTVLTFLGHVTSSVTWPFDWAWAIYYRCSISTDTISGGFRDIEAQMYLGTVTTIFFRGMWFHIGGLLTLSS